MSLYMQCILYFQYFFFIFLIKFSDIRLYGNYITIIYIETFYHFFFIIFYLNLIFLFQANQMILN